MYMPLIPLPVLIEYKLNMYNCCYVQQFDYGKVNFTIVNIVLCVYTQRFTVAKKLKAGYSYCI